MAGDGARTIVIVGGTSGIGLELARDTIARGDRVVITGRDQARTEEIAATLGPDASAVALDISEPKTIAGQLGRYRFTGRGYCTQPARAVVDASGAVLVSRFDVDAIVEYPREP